MIVLDKAALDVVDRVGVFPAHLPQKRFERLSPGIDPLVVLDIIRGQIAVDRVGIHGFEHMVEHRHDEFEIALFLLCAGHIILIPSFRWRLIALCHYDNDRY